MSILLFQILAIGLVFYFLIVRPQGAARKRHAEMLERIKANGVAITAGPLLIISPAIYSFYFFDPNGIRLEIVTDRNGPDEDFALVRSCVMSETEMRAQLRSIGGEAAWIDDMIEAQAR